MPEHTPDEIIRMIDGMEMDRSEVQDRMDQDFDRYNLEPYQGEMDEDGEPILDGYKKFTANDPRTTMNLALHLGSTSKRTTTTLTTGSLFTSRTVWYSTSRTFFTLSWLNYPSGPSSSLCF
jgi:hypothetical protein